MRLAPVTVCALLAAGCPSGGGAYKQPSPAATAPDIVARLAKLRDTRRSYVAKTIMDYWLGKDRLKGEVWVMGTANRQVRFNAYSPQQSVLVDMACNGTNFTFVDMQNNCQLAGPCDKSSIAQLLRVELEPDDFAGFAVGVPPVLANAIGTVTWDAKQGYERVALSSPQGKQSIVIDAREGRSDVLSSELVGPDGKVVWSVENAEFTSIKDEAGVAHRVPGKTRFKAPDRAADLLVDWTERQLNKDLPADKFVVPVPSNLPACGATKPAP
ncbi:MAG: hypothetical protein WKG01_24475 [Kofleriaceae bacterium]